MNRRRRLTLALLIAFTLAGLLVVALQSSQARRSADFTINYSAALLIRQGQADAIYDRPRLGPLMLRLSNAAIDPRLPFDAPLALALPYVPLTFLPLELAFHVWQVITVVLLLLALVLMRRWLPLPRPALWVGFLALLAFPATWALLAEGQSSAMLLVGAALLIGALRRDLWWLGGAGSALLAMKPHYLPVYLILLLAGRRWRALAGAAGGSLLVALSPLLAGGLAGVASMIWSALESGQGVIRYNESLIGTLAPLLPGSSATYVGFAIWVLALIGLSGLALFRPLTEGCSDTRAMTLGVLMTSAGLLLAPHALAYDLVLLAVPAWISFELQRQRKAADPSPAWMMVGLALLVDLHASIVPLAPIAIVGVLGWTLWSARPQPNSQEQRTPLASAG